MLKSLDFGKFTPVWAVNLVNETRGRMFQNPGMLVGFVWVGACMKNSLGFGKRLCTILEHL